MEITVIPKKEPTLPLDSNGQIKKLKVAAYARVSTDMDDQKNSFEFQKSEFEQRIKNNPEWEFVKMYSDEGISGTSTKNRKSFNQMINDAKAGKIDYILVKSISRFARNTVDFLKNVRELTAINVGVYFEKENIDTSKDNVDLVLTLYAALAESESRSISENVKWGVRKRMKRNEKKVPVGKTIGYTYHSDGSWTVNEEAFLIKDVFNYFLAGYTYRQIVSKMKEEDPNDKRKWDIAKIYRILRNERYKGYIIHQKTVTLDVLTHKQVKNDGIEEQYIIKDHHQAIIREETFDYVQELLKRLSHEFFTYSKSTRDSFSGIVYCENCGRVMRKVKYNYNNECFLTCKNVSKKDELYVPCDSNVLSLSILEEISNEVISKIRTEEPLSATFTMALIEELSSRNFESEIKELSSRIKNVNESISELVKKQVESNNSDEYEVEFERLKSKRNLLQNEYEKVCELAKDNYVLQRNLQEIRHFLGKPSNYKSQEFDSLIKIILHRKDGSIRFGIKGKKCESLSKEEVWNELVNNTPVLSGIFNSKDSSFKYDVVWIGGRKNA